MATFPGGRGSKWSLRSTQEEQRGLNRRQDRQFMIDLGKSVLDLGTTLGLEYVKYEKLGGKEDTASRSYEALAEGTKAGAKMKEAEAQVTRADAYKASSKAASDLAVKQLAADIKSGKAQRTSAETIAKLDALAQVDAAKANQRGSQALAAAQTKVAQIQADVSLNTQDKAQLEKKVAVAVATRNSLSKYKEGSPAWQRVFKNFTNQVLSLDNLADKITGRSTAVDVPPVGAQTTPTGPDPATVSGMIEIAAKKMGIGRRVLTLSGDPTKFPTWYDAGVKASLDAVAPGMDSMPITIGPSTTTKKKLLDSLLQGGYIERRKQFASLMGLAAANPPDVTATTIVNNIIAAMKKEDTGGGAGWREHF